jgi:AraC-like DNA-binding protein
VTDAGAPTRRDVPPGVLRRPARDHFELHRRPVSPGLAGVIEYHWSVDWSIPPGETRAQDVVTHPSVHMTVEPDRETVTGVVTRSFRRELTGTGRVVGVRFRPSGFAALWPEPVSRLTDLARPVAEVLGPEAAAELERVRSEPDLDDAVREMEAFVERHRRPLPRAAELVDEAVDHIVAAPGVTRVDQVADRFGVSARTLQRRFERYLGVGPKWVIQRRRIHDALAEIESGRDLDWSALALRLGFADQAHLVNAFTELVGQPPSHYQRRPDRDGPDGRDGPEDP